MTPASFHADINTQITIVPSSSMQPARASTEPEQVHAPGWPRVGRAAPEGVEIHPDRILALPAERGHPRRQSDEVVTAHRDPVTLRPRGASRVGDVVDAVDGRVHRAVISEMDLVDA